jgi:predicted nucleic acid-binding protein
VIGIDTSFLVAFEDSSHRLHAAARSVADRYAAEIFALAPQVLTEFVHVVTDPRRFQHPLTMDEALKRAAKWWDARETRRVVPNDKSVSLFVEWMSRFNLGRKRILDTMLAATYKSAGVALIASTNARDFAVFPGMHPVLVTD